MSGERHFDLRAIYQLSYISYSEVKGIAGETMRRGAEMGKDCEGCCSGAHQLKFSVPTFTKNVKVGQPPRRRRCNESSVSAEDFLLIRY